MMLQKFSENFGKLLKFGIIRKKKVENMKFEDYINRVTKNFNDNRIIKKVNIFFLKY